MINGTKKLTLGMYTVQHTKKDQLEDIFAKKRIKITVTKETKNKSEGSKETAITLLMIVLEPHMKELNRVTV
jgi:hypothetical protein